MLDKLKQVQQSYSVLKKWKYSLPAICYHSIQSDTNQENLHNVSPENLHRQLRFLLKKGYTFLNADDFLSEKKKGTKKITSVTFDDGYSSVLTYALPVLKGLNIPATIFITTSTFQDKTIWRDNVRKLISNNLIDRFKRYLIQGDKKIHQDINWNDIYRSTKKNHINSKIFDQLLSSFLSDIDLKESFPQEKYIQLHDLKKQNSDLVFIGNHSHNHYRLSSLSIDEQAEEIETARSILTEHDVQSSDVFCIPFGENSSFNQTTINLLSDYKYCGFLMTNQPQFGLQVPNISVNPHNLLYSNRVLLRDNRFPLLM